MLKPVDLLTWNADLGYGFFPVAPEEWPYDAAYVQKYEAYEGSDMTRKLNDHRVRLALAAGKPFDVNRHVVNYIDIGPGAGTFIKAMSEELPEGEDLVFGFDVNPEMVKRLKEQKRFAEPSGMFPNGDYENDPRFWDVMCFWDSFEHIHRPDITIRSAKTIVMSIPIFKNREDVLASKHFRPDEHVWYFTHDGLVAFMERCGFMLTHTDDVETRLGREGIRSYIFRCA